MNNKTPLFLLIILFFFAFVYQAKSQGKIVFEKTSHDFGTIKEIDGRAEAVFKFTNEGNEPIILTQVKSSCGCVTPEWTREPVLPNKSGFVKAIYNPSNRPGRFRKSLTVKTNSEPKIILLYLHGQVIPKKRGIIDFYPTLIGNMRANSRNIYFGNVFNTNKATKEMVFYNQGEKPLNLKFSETKLPTHISIENQENLTIRPKDSVKIKFIFDATKREDWGYVSDNFFLITDDEKDPKKRFYVSVIIKDKQGKRGKYPKVKFERLVHDFGKVYRGIHNTSFKVTNKGKANLILRKVKTSMMRESLRRLMDSFTSLFNITCFAINEACSFSLPFIG